MSVVSNTVNAAVDKLPGLLNGALAEIDPLLAETDDNLVFGLVYWVEVLILLVVFLVVTSLLKLGDGKINFFGPNWDAGEYIMLATGAFIAARVLVRKTGSDLFGLSMLTGYTEKQVKVFAKKVSSAF